MVTKRIDDMVFFCGKYDTSGVVGYFQESLFASGTGNVNYIIVPEIESLKKMDVYLDQTSQRYVVAAVGDNFKYYPVVESGLFLFEFYASTVTYNYFKFNNYRLYQDVAATDNYIVATGVYDIYLNRMALTVIDKNNLTSFDAYNPTETAGDMNSLIYSVKHLEGDFVAISTLVLDSTTPTYHSVPVPVLDASVPDFINSQKFSVLEKASTYNEMLYYQEYNTLLLLHNNYYPNNNDLNSVVYYLDPFQTTSYSALLTYDTASSYYSLDRFPGSHFLATGKRQNKYHSFMIHDSQSQPKFTCLQSDYEKVLDITLPTANYIANLTFIKKDTSLISFSPKIQQLHSNTDCVQP